MRRFGFVVELLREVVEFAAANRVWWIVPIVVIILAVAGMMLAGQGAAPLIYTLF